MGLEDTREAVLTGSSIRGLCISALLELEAIHGRSIGGERARRSGRPLICERGTSCRSHTARNPFDVSAVPRRLHRLRQLNRDVGDADAGEGRAGDALQPRRHGDVVSHHLAVADPLHHRDGVGVVLVVGVRLVAPRHPEHPLHGVQIHPPHEDVLHVGASAHRRLDPDARLRVQRGDVLRPHVSDPAGHLAPQGDHRAGRRDAGEPSDDDVLARHPVGDAVLVPPALDRHAVVAGHYVAVLDPDIGAGVCQIKKKNLSDSCIPP
ncbi:hypothetical protein MUK42_35945 [Musa troglodytarum]|uniref:Uncharacterized protein n=1 Tax=Musa troglodytarum TaxID=320322 RepID=A0A9E7E7Q5_9LILI|nr:hypothetical protein MUK42_35945 [Musa troglodytarum]